MYKIIICSYVCKMKIIVSVYDVIYNNIILYLKENVFVKLL